MMVEYLKGLLGCGGEQDLCSNTAPIREVSQCANACETN